MKKIILLLATCCAFALLKAQTKNDSYPEIGKPCPDFLLEKVQYYNQNKVSLADLKGKYFILDFWDKSCLACIQSFPKINRLQEQFKGKLQIILVGRDDTSKKIQPLYEMLRKENDLKLTYAFDTTLINHMVYPKAGVPNLVWVDGNGIVKAITESGDATEQNIYSFLSGQKFSFYDASYQGIIARRESYDRFKPLLINQNGGNDAEFLFRSLLTNWKPNMAYDLTDIDGYIRTKHSMFQITGAPLTSLYNIAFFGNTLPIGKDIYAHPILNLKDTSDFIVDKGGIQTGMFCYSLSVPPKKASKGYLMKCMQNDLKNYFQYEAKIEEREMPCYILIVTDQSKLPISHGPTKRKKTWSKAQGGNVDDIPMSEVVRFLNVGIPNSTHLYDETGITQNIDLHINASMTNLESVNSILKDIGMEIKSVRRKLKVLVISDSIS
jgi:thiol-disulfide isomerase/thioredoxin